MCVPQAHKIGDGDKGLAQAHVVPEPTVAHLHAIYGEDLVTSWGRDQPIDVVKNFGVVRFVPRRACLAGLDIHKVCACKPAPKRMVWEVNALVGMGLDERFVFWSEV